jgi:[NiFe] hydrogenase assembly HybE family chaperone
VPTVGERNGPDSGTADGRFECGICWWVYDPATGDARGQVPAGVAFSDLPGHWRCPECDAEPAKFLAVGGDVVADARAAPPEAEAPRADLPRRLVEAFRARDHELRGLPVHHPLLEVEAVGFRRVGDAVLGIVITPWCMNLVRIGDDTAEHAEGEAHDYALPAGTLMFHAGRLPGFGALEQASLFSPMTEFADQAAARAVAEEALRLLLSPAATSRRGLMARSGAGER